MDLVISTVEAADLGEILTLQRAAYVTEAQLHSDAHLPPLTETLAQLTATMAEITALPDAGLALKARLGHRIVGSVRARAQGPVLNIGRLAVAPDLQGRGIGTRLLRAAEAAAPAQIQLFALFTGPRSEANVRLYERLGYVVQNHRGPDAVIHLEKKLPDVDH